MENSHNKTMSERIVYTAAYGILWGILEIVLKGISGSMLLFTRGLLFSFFTLLILLYAKKFADFKFSLIAIAIIAIVVKSASSGLSFSYSLAILLEAVIAEIVLMVFKWERKSALIAGCLIFLYSYIHGLVFHGSLPNNYIEYYYKSMLSGLTGIESTSAVPAFLVFGVIAGLVGLLAGYVVWLIADRYALKTKLWIEEIVYVK
ncbi:MAG: hypothetical protein AB9882_06810 [Ignavibacteriaceae bacterium]